MRRLFSLWRNLVHRDRVERDLDDELRTTFDLLVDEKIRAGLPPAAARRAARLELGATESIKDGVRDRRAGAVLEAVARDARHGFRLLFRSPSFTLFAVASLACGIGATAAIFTLFDRIVQRPLPVPEADRLVVASFGVPGTTFNYSLPYPQFEQIRQHSRTLDGVFAVSPIGRVAVARRAEPDLAEGLFVSGEYYETLRLRPALGRLLGPLDDRPAQSVAVISHAYWQRRFGGDPGIVGAAVTVNQLPFTIVGVEPEGFAGTEIGRPYDVSLPMRAVETLRTGRPPWNEAFATWIYVMARLAPEASLAQAEAEVREIFRRTGLDAADSPSEVRLATQYILRLESGRTGGISGLRDGQRRPLRILLIALAAMLLLACLNVATLLLSRSDARYREIATRLALGASRWRVVGQFFTESLVLAGLAGALGLVVASWGSRVLLSVAQPAAERPPLDLSMDLRVIAFTLGVSFLACTLFGLIPAIRATSSRSLVTAHQIGAGPRRLWLDRSLVGAQVALSLILLTGAGLFLRTLGNIWALNTGYERDDILMFSVDAALAGKRGPEVVTTYRRLLDELHTVPGAQSVTASVVRPVSDSYYLVDSVGQIGDTPMAEDRRIRVAFNLVAPRYFETLRIPLVAGRDFDEKDAFGAPRVVIISERMARHFEGSPVGQRLGRGADMAEVVGVVRDVRYARVKDAPRELLYFPLFQRPPGFTPSFELRYQGPAADALQSIRAAVARTDAGLTIFSVKTLEAQTRESLSRERLLAMITTSVGLFAVLLSCIGLYGLINYGVRRRTPELALRLALGAQPGEVSRLLLREAAIIVPAAAAAGLAGSLAAMQIVESQLFGVRPHDPAVLGGATLMVVMMALAAACLPARRAARTNPVTALRCE